MSELPKGWAIANLGDIAIDIQGGGTPSKNVAENFSGEIPFMTVKDMKTYRPTDTQDKITEKALQSCSSKLIPAGTPIICTRMGLGKIVVVDFSTAINQDLKAVFLEKRLIAVKYFEYWYRCIFEKINSMGTGTTVKGITLKQLQELQIPIPPAGEQTRIAQKLDELLAQVDTLKARIYAIPALLKRFRQSVLAAAVSGRLTEEWRLENSSAEWRTITVGELCKLKSGIAVSADIEKAKGDFKYFKVGEMNLEGNEFFLQKTDRYLAQDDAPEKSLMPAGAIVFPKRGGAIATNKKRILKDASFVDLNVMGIIAPEGVESLYIYRWFETVDLAKLNTGSTIPQVNNTDIAPLVIPLPPLTEQAEIVRRVEQLFVLANQLETKVTTAQARIDRLTQSLLAKAFRGELVPQDPNDEPASVLLERIKTQRDTAPKAKRGRKASA